MFCLGLRKGSSVEREQRVNVASVQCVLIEPLSNLEPTLTLRLSIYRFFFHLYQTYHSPSSPGIERIIKNTIIMVTMQSEADVTLEISLHRVRQNGLCSLKGLVLKLWWG